MFIFFKRRKRAREEKEACVSMEMELMCGSVDSWCKANSIESIHRLKSLAVFLFYL